MNNHCLITSIDPKQCRGQIIDNFKTDKRIVKMLDLHRLESAILLEEILIAHAALQADQANIFALDLIGDNKQTVYGPETHLLLHQLSLEVYMLILDLQQHAFGKYQIKLQQVVIDLKQKHARIAEMLRENVTSVEIVHDNVIHKHFFRIPDVCLRVWSKPVLRNQCEERIQDIPRDNPVEKAEQMMCRMKDLRDMMGHMRQLLSNQFTEKLVEYQQQIDNLPFMSTVVIMLFVWAGYGHPSHPYEDYPVISAVVDILGIVQVLVAIMFSTTYYLVTAPLESKQPHMIKHNIDRTIIADHASQVHDSKLSIVEASPVEKDKESNYLAGSPLVGTSGFVRLIENLPNVMTTYVLTSMGIYCIIFTVISIVAADLSNPDLRFISSFLLFDYFRLPAGKTILRSVLEGATGLYNSAKAGLVIIFAFSCLGFLFFRTYIDEQQNCETAWQCIFLGLNAGVHGDLGLQHGDNFGNVLGNALTPFPLSFTDQPFREFQWVFVITFFIIWEFLLAGIIQGQIVDAFAGIRAQETARAQDLQAYCLVCSLDRFSLERQGGGFLHHRENDHSTSSYLFFLVLLDETSLGKHTGLQRYVHMCLSADDVAFLPINSCLAMQRSPYRLNDVHSTIKVELPRFVKMRE